MSLSLIFSFWVYHEATRELKTGLYAKPQNLDSEIRQLPVVFVQQRIKEGRQRVFVNLAFFNAGVFIAGSTISYFLARRTMRPIKDAMAAQDRFTADASHELRTPLAVMKAEIEVALRDKKRTKKETDELLKSNVEEIDRLSNLAEGLLTLSHTNSKSNNKTEVSEVIAKAISRFEKIAAKKNIKIKPNQLKSRIVLINNTDLDKVITILIDNAIKYSPARSVINISMLTKDTQVIIEIADNGQGISKNDLPHIFDRFYRTDTSRSEQGYGLGLSIAKKIIEYNDGSISVKSQLNHGSTFIITLPTKK